MVIILYKTLKKTRRIYAQKDSAVFQINLKYLIFNNLKTLEDISNAPNSHHRESHACWWYYQWRLVVCVGCLWNVFFEIDALKMLTKFEQEAGPKLLWLQQTRHRDLSETFRIEKFLKFENLSKLVGQRRTSGSCSYLTSGQRRCLLRLFVDWRKRNERTH